MKKNTTQKYKLTRLILFVLISGLAANGFAQNKTGDVSERKFKLHITVTDLNGKNHTNLQSGDFRIFADGEKQEILGLEKADRPLSVGILVDVSGSMYRQLKITRAALLEFLSKSNPQNEYFLATFSDRVAERLDLTGDPQKLFDAIRDIPELETENYTKMFEAIDYGFAKMARAGSEKRVLLIISDGQDNESETKYKTVRKMAERSDILVYSVIPPIGRDIAFSGIGMEAADNLDTISRFTGGQLFFPKTGEEMLETLGRIALELRNQYEITFRIDREIYRKAKLTDKGIRVKAKAKPSTYQTDRGKMRTRKSYVRTRRKIFVSK